MRRLTFVLLALLISFGVHAQQAPLRVSLAPVLSPTENQTLIFAVLADQRDYIRKTTLDGWWRYQNPARYPPREGKPITPNIVPAVLFSQPGTPSAPIVTSVTSTPSSGNVTSPGGTITFAIGFNQTVFVAGGTPTLNLGTTPTGTAASCGSGSGTNTLSCSYTAGSNTESPVTTTSSAISLNGATIQNASSQNAVLTGANSVTFAINIVSGGGACVGTQYYVSNSGNDSNNGTSTATAWLTPNKANGASFGPNDCVSFNGNDATCTGYISGNTLTITSCSTGTIHVGDPVSGVGVFQESNITAFGSGLGGSGTYTLCCDAQTVASSGSPITMTMGQVFTVPAPPDSDAMCLRFSRTNVPSGGTSGNNFTINSYGGGTAAIFASAACVNANSYPGSAIAGQDGINSTWTNLNTYANGLNAYIGHQLQNNYTGTLSTMVVSQSAFVDMQTTTAVSTSNGRSQGTSALFNNPVTNVTYSGITVTGASGPSSPMDTGINFLNSAAAVTNFLIIGPTCKNVGARNAFPETGSCIGYTNNSTSYVIKYFIIHDIAGNVNSCGGMAGFEWYAAANATAQYGEVYRVQPITYSGGCDFDGGDSDGGTTNTLMDYVYYHENFGNVFLHYMQNGSNNWGATCNIIRYSISEHDGFGGNGAAGIATSAGSVAGCSKIYNTTFLNTTTTAGAQGGLTLDMGIGGTPGSGFVENNIFAAASLFAQNNYLDFYGNSTPSWSFNHNAYYPLTSATFQVTNYNGTTYTSLASWQGAAPGGEVGAIQSNPNFLLAPPHGYCGPGGTGGLVASITEGPQPCPTNYELVTGSPYIGAGVAVSGSGTVDYYGNTISNPPNIGAYGGTGVP